MRNTNFKIINHELNEIHIVTDLRQMFDKISLISRHTNNFEIRHLVTTIYKDNGVAYPLYEKDMLKCYFKDDTGKDIMEHYTVEYNEGKAMYYLNSDTGMIKRETLKIEDLQYIKFKII